MKTIATRTTLVWISLMAIGLFFTNLSYAKITPGTCAGLWLFDEGEGDVAEDSSGNGNDGTLVNGPKWVDGKFGGALSFDGIDDYVDCGKDESINNIADAITVVAWVYPREEDGSYILSNDGGVQAAGRFKGYSLNLFSSGFLIWDSNSAFSWLFLASKPSLNEWCHIAGTFDGKQLKIYLDGQLSDSVVGPKTIGTPASFNLAIGGLGQNPKEKNINGVIDEVAIFNVALTENDIESIMTKGLEAVGAGAVSPSGKLTTVWATIKAQY